MQIPVNDDGTFTCPDNDINVPLNVCQVCDMYLRNHHGRVFCAWTLIPMEPTTDKEYDTKW